VTFVRLLLPSLFLVYFVWRSLRQRVFLLGLPFLMTMYYSVFFDKLVPFWSPHQWAPADHMMFWLLITWIVYFDLLLPRRRRTAGAARLFGPRLSWPEEVVLVGLAGYVALQVGLTALHYADLWSALAQARGYLYAFAGYFLLRGVFCHARRDETVDFVTAIVVVNSIAAVLYVLHEGLHVGHIYVAVVEYQTLVFNGHILTRSFYFMPQLLPLAVAFTAAKPKWNPFWVGVLLVNLAAVWVSYTRALVIVALVEIAIVLLVRLVRAHEGAISVKRAAQIIAVLTLFTAAVITLLPNDSAYLFSRFTGSAAQGGVSTAGTLKVRWTELKTTYEWVGSDNVQGVGFPSAAQDGRVTRVGQMAADLVWVPTVWSLGLLGVAALMCLFLAFGWRAMKLSLSGSGDEALLSIVLLGVVVGVFLQGFVQWTIFDPWHTPTALWFFALVTAEAWRRDVSAHEDAPDAGRQPVLLKREADG
jgi:hypothetical protein